MPSEGVVDALERVHRSLRPGGLLLDVHPQALPSPLELHTNAYATDLGHLEYGPDVIQTLSNSDEVLASLDQGGTFRNERDEEFLLLHHFESFAEWQDFMAQEAEYYVPPDSTMIEKIGQGLLLKGAELVLKEWVGASRFRRLG